MAVQWLYILFTLMSLLHKKDLFYAKLTSLSQNFPCCTHVSFPVPAEFSTQTIHRSWTLLEDAWLTPFSDRSSLKWDCLWSYCSSFWHTFGVGFVCLHTFKMVGSISWIGLSFCLRGLGCFWILSNLFDPDIIKKKDGQSSQTLEKKFNTVYKYYSNQP